MLLIVLRVSYVPPWCRAMLNHRKDMPRSSRERWTEDHFNVCANMCEVNNAAIRSGSVALTDHFEPLLLDRVVSPDETR